MVGSVDGLATNLIFALEYTNLPELYGDRLSRETDLGSPPTWLGEPRSFCHVCRLHCHLKLDKSNLRVHRIPKQWEHFLFYSTRHAFARIYVVFLEKKTGIFVDGRNQQIESWCSSDSRQRWLRHLVIAITVLWFRLRANRFIPKPHTKPQGSLCCLRYSVHMCCRVGVFSFQSASAGTVLWQSEDIFMAPPYRRWFAVMAFILLSSTHWLLTSRIHSSHYWLPFWSFRNASDLRCL